MTGYSLLRQINSKLLYIASILIGAYEDDLKRKTGSIHGEGFFDFNTFSLPEGIEGMINQQGWEKYLIVILCKRYGIVKEIYADIVEWEDWSKMLESHHFQYGVDGFDIPLTQFENKKTTLLFSVKLDVKKTRDFIDEYMFKWINDELFLNTKNLLMAEKQIGEIIMEMYQLLEKHPPKNLIVKQDPYWDDLDFIAVLFFLKNINDIEIIEIDAFKDILSRVLWKSRVNLKDKFYKDFEGSKSYKAVLDFKYLKTGKRSEKDEKTKQVLTTTVINKIQDKRGSTSKEETLKFDDKKGDLVIGKNRTHIADEGDYQHHICVELLSKNIAFGDWVKEQDLEDSYSLGEPKSGRWVRDAVYKINKKLKNKVKGLFVYKKAKVRIDQEALKQ